MNIYIASDHGGFELKKKLVDSLIASTEFTDITISDLGPEKLVEDDDYPDFAVRVSEKISQDKNALGILICRSGNGMVIAANKTREVYAALCFTELHAQKAREDDNANVLCLDADYEDLESHLKIVKAFLKTPFGSEERFMRRFKKVEDLESENFK